MNNTIKIIIGLGNPGKQYYHNRHNIGFLILDKLASEYNLVWQKKSDYESAELKLKNEKITLIKPHTFMNNSGKIIPSLLKQGIKPENILVVHDELEKPFGKVELKFGGSHHGHNGLRSIIEFCGKDFMRLRFGIGRPQHKNDVPQYVLSNFNENIIDIEQIIDQAIVIIKELLQRQP
ncbi:MAG TPA: aminoacyl-tRNA hydrolase [Candidatus Babeliales bacterium]|nr:aminoacyl-tRNA hydrolase [Candidatus Babeliales bacterium]